MAKLFISLEANELRTHLNEQIGFLHRSGELYDAGHWSEAKRLATHATILAFDSGVKSKNLSLISLLGLREDLRILSTADRMYPGLINYAPEMRLCGFRLSANPELSGYYPYLDQSLNIGTWVTLQEWWNEPVIVAHERFSYTRSDLVKWFRDQEGGAHAAPLVPRDLYEFSRRNGPGISFGGGGSESRPPSHGPEYATIRQIGWELEYSLRLNLSEIEASSWDGRVGDNHIRKVVLSEPSNDGDFCTFSVTTIGGRILSLSTSSDGLEVLLSQLEHLAQAAETKRRKAGSERLEPHPEIRNFKTWMSKIEIKRNSPPSRAPATLIIWRGGRPPIEIEVSENIAEGFNRLMEPEEPSWQSKIRRLYTDIRLWLISLPARMRLFFRRAKAKFRKRRAR